MNLYSAFAALLCSRLYTSKVLRYGPCVTRGSLSFTCHPHTNHLYSPDARRHCPVQLVCIVPTNKGWPGWVGLRDWLHIAINVPHRKLNPDTVTHPRTNRDRRRLTSLIETNALPLRQTTDGNLVNSIRPERPKGSEPELTGILPTVGLYERISFRRSRVRRSRSCVLVHVLWVPLEAETGVTIHSQRQRPAARGHSRSQTAF